MNRPATHGSVVTTPRAATLLKLLGGQRAGSVSFTTDEFQAINKLYGLKPEKPNKKPPPPEAPKSEDFEKTHQYEGAVRKHKEALKRHGNWQDPRPLMQAGADRNAIRHAEVDGLRMVAWLAQFMEPGEDPMKALIRLVVDAGWDVDPEDITWAECEVEVPEESDE